MAELKYEKCFNAEPKADLKLPPYRHDYNFIKRVTHIDAETVPGADFYNESMWILPDASTKDGKVLKDAHKHTWGQYLGFYVYNFDDIHSLGAEIEFTIDGETYHITESFSAFIPAGIEHGPLIIKNVTLPIFHFAAGSCDIYS